jgi:G3E family GTPase
VSARTPVALVTGYLGSGKTTLIRRLLADPEMGEAAVIVNELGEIGLDHAILRQVDERTVLLASGCLCCTLRGDLADELRDLVNRRDAGEIPPFRRVVVETTGLADPAPIVNTLLADPLVRHQYALETVVATVDAQHGLRGHEAERQVAAADVLAVTKVDLADPTALAGELGDLNPVAGVVHSARGDVSLRTLLEARGGVPRVAAVDTDHAHRHEEGITSVSVVLEGAIDWLGFGVWLTALLHARGPDVLRVKGLLDVGGEGPLLINAVQHVVHPPEHLDAWPDDDHRSRLVFIGRGFDAGGLERSLTAFAPSGA